MTIRIERVKPRGGIAEEPAWTPRGFQLVNPRVRGKKNKAENSTFVKSLEEAAYLIEQGYWIRMSRPGKRPSLISPKSLRIIKS